MQATFDVHGVKVGVMSNSHVGSGIVELSIMQREPMVVAGSGVIPGEPVRLEGYSLDDKPPEHYLMLCLGKGEARAIASAIMGAAAEL